MAWVRVYLCRERELRSVVPRHFVAPLAVCEEVKLLRLSDIPELLGSEEVTKLSSYGEVVVSKRETMEKILGFRVEEPSYIRLVLEN